MNDSTRRAIRTGVDTLLGLLASIAVVFVVPGFEDWMNDQGWGKAFATAALMVVVLTAFLTKLKNWLEDEHNFPALLKAPASDGQNPVGGE